MKHLKKIFIDGKDGTGWSIDSDRFQLSACISAAGFEQTDSLYKADVVHNVWWNLLGSFNVRNTIRKVLRTPTLATASNFVNLEDEGYALKKEFTKVSSGVTAWLAPSVRQKTMFDKHNIRSFYFPFLVDLDLFKPIIRTPELYERIGIPVSLTEGRVVIGSFQRDSLGSDLTKPKWQKGPEQLVSLLKVLPPEKYLLLLAGPRRHYLIGECKKYGIPYFYIGKETTVDDLVLNALPIDKMPDLYAITDIYLVTSRSEGGPKAAIEATSSKTFILSTDVGLAPDFISEENVFDDNGAFAKKLHDIVDNYSNCKGFIDECIDRQFKKCHNLLSTSAIITRLKSIYTQLGNAV